MLTDVMRGSIEMKKRIREEALFKARRTIYSRGLRYFKQGNVFGLRLRPEKNNPESQIEIIGEVSGSHDYEVRAVFDLETHNFINEDCDCPCDFFCKHTVAVFLEFAEMYKKFLQKAEHANGSLRVEFLDAKQELNSFIGWAKDQNNLAVDEVRTQHPRVKSPASQSSETISVDDEFLEKLKSIGINPESLLDEMLQSLEVSMKNAERIMNNALGKQGDELKGKKHKTTQQTVAIKKRKKKLTNKFYIVLRISSFGFSIGLADKNNNTERYYYNYRSYLDSDEIEDLLLDESLEITKYQKQLLKFLIETDFWEDKIEFEKLFKILELSEMNIFLNLNHQGERRAQLLIDNNGHKIKTGLITSEWERELEWIDYKFWRTDFFLTVDKKYFKKIKERIIAGKDGVLTVEGNNKVIFHKMSSRLTKIISRVRSGTIYIYSEGETHNKSLIQTELVSEEIFKLNDIIKELKERTDLTTELKADFKIKKFNKAEKSFLVDYNSKESSLKVYPTIDYGFCQIPVAETVFYSKRKSGSGYRRRDFAQAKGDYIKEINLEAKTIFYAPASKRKEINFFKELIDNGQYEEFGFTKTGKCNIQGDKKIWDYYENFWPAIQNLKYPIKFFKDKFKFTKSDFKADFKVDLNADKDLLAFDVDCYCGEDKITLKTLQQYINDKEGFIRMKGGKLLRIANRAELEKFILMLESFYQQKDNKFEGKIYHAPELEDVFTSSDYYNAKLDQGFKKFMKEAKAGKPVEKVKITNTFKKIMRDYQQEGMDWFYFLRKYRFAGVLADDMGLGKTLQALALIDMNTPKKNSKKIKKKPSLVVCPKTLLYNWQMEAEKFMPKMKTIVIDGFPKERIASIKEADKNDLVITGYHTLQRDLEYYKKQKIAFNYCVLDEAQTIKNHRTKNAQTVKQVDADYRLALTGTPLENTVEEIWSIFDFLMPGFLGSHRAFSKKFLKPIMKESNAESLKSLRQKTSCFMLRRTKGEVLKELPPKIENIKYCQLEDEQNILYQEILANVKSDIFDTVKQKGFAKSQIHILAGLTKLRQVCNHPNLLLKKKNYAKYNSAKLEVFHELISEIISSGQKVLVFSQFTTMLDILETELKKKKIKSLYLSGQTKNRQQLIDEFNEDKEKQVFLISLKAGGVGLNLTVADNVIIFDPWWNPSVENQAIDRTHRIGQKKSVNVYRLITRGTIEEKIVELQQKKQNLFDNLVGESKDMFKKLTWEDVKNLFGE